MKNLIIAITGASGAIYGIKILELLKDLDDVETSLIISKTANITITHETDYTIKDVQNLANYNYNINDLAACISSGSYKVDGMLITPCSVKTMAQIATGNTDNLISRAADVILKERKKLLILLRETPLHTGHIQNMLSLSMMGGIIAPPVPAFYNKPESIDDIVHHTISRALDLFDIYSNSVKRWNGL
ncbi:MAG: UbiX family flavin prenyltransferase [Pseudomonadota bacterium]